jgi:hypothetical protein
MEQKMSSLLQPKIDVAPSLVSETDRRAMGSKPIEFQVLGPTEVRPGGRAIPLSGARRRAMVTRLPLDAGRAISADTLLEDVWATKHLPRRWRRCRAMSPSFGKSSATAFSEAQSVVLVWGTKAQHRQVQRRSSWQTEPREWGSG